MTTLSSEPKSLGEILKEQLLLVGFLVLYAGIVTTDAYYGTLSVGYQFLSLPASHLIYRGVTTLAEIPALLIVYAVAVAWLMLDDHLIRTTAKYSKCRAPAAYALIMLLLTVTFPLARRGGVRAAQRDLWDGTSTLPRVHVVTTAGEDLRAEDRWRLVLQSTGRVAVVQILTPTETTLNAKPIIRYFPESELKSMETEPRETRSPGTPSPPRTSDAR